MKYLIVIEPTSTGFSAYSPDLPGCVSRARRAMNVKATCMKPSRFISTDFVKKAKPFPARSRLPHSSKLHDRHYESMRGGGGEAVVVELVERDGAGEGVGADARAAELREMAADAEGGADVAGEGADVRAAAAVDAELQQRPVVVQ